MKKDKDFIYREDMNTREKRDMKYQIKADGKLYLREDIKSELETLQGRMVEDMRSIAYALQNGETPKTNMIDCRNFWLDTTSKALKEHGIQSRDNEVITSVFINESFNHELAEIQG